MIDLPEAIERAWSRREGPVVLTTADSEGMPNAAYVTCIQLLDDGRFVVCDNFFTKTRANIRAGSRCSLLFITPDPTPFQVKGTVEYVESGPEYEEMLTWVDEGLPRVATVLVTPEEAYSGSQRLM